MPRPKGTKTKKQQGESTGRRFTLTDRERLKHEIQQDDLKGYGQIQIAERRNCSQATVSNILKEIQQDYQDAYVDNRKVWATRASLAHFKVICEAWEQIDKLKERGRKKRRSESGENQFGGFSKDVEEVEDGDVAGYMAIIQKGWIEIAAIQGIKDLPAQIFNVQVNNTQINTFDRLLAAVLGEPAQPAIVNVDEPVKGGTS